MSEEGSIKILDSSVSEDEEGSIKINQCSLGFDYGFKFIDEVGRIDYDWSQNYYCDYYCKDCDEQVVDSYGEIITALIKSELIKKNFELLCCVCFEKRKRKGSD